MPTKIFISYRKDDSKNAANRLRKNLEEKFDKEIVFMDTEDIKPGDKWEEKIKDAMQEAAVVLLIIGKKICAIPDGEHARKTGDENDWVCREVNTALDLGKTLIPVLVDQAKVPPTDELRNAPQFIQEAFKRQCSYIGKSPNTNEDVNNLITCIIDKLDLDQKFRLSVRKDKYKIEKLIYQGTIANVYLALEIPLERKVAIKVVKDDYEEEFKRILKDASKISVRVPNSIQIYDAYLEKKPFHVVMNYLGKDTFRQLIDNTYPKNKRVDASEVRDYLLQIGDALKHAHMDNVTHCNIKPSNILKSDNGLAYLSPLCMLDDNCVEEEAIKNRFFPESRCIHDSLYKEDLFYIAPEILGEKNDFNIEERKKIDQYMLGMFGYELLVGKIEITANTFDELKRGSPDLFERLPSIRATRNDCPDKLANIIEKMISIDPEDRYLNMDRVVQKLSEVIFDDVERARESYRRCLQFKNNEKGFFEAFYDAFIGLSKQAGEKFKDIAKREQQYKKLSASIHHIFAFAEDNSGRSQPEEPNALSWTAERHKAEGIYEHSYDEFQEALLRTVCEYDEYCKKTNLKSKIINAWQNVLEPSIKYMQKKTRERSDS